MEDWLHWEEAFTHTLSQSEVIVSHDEAEKAAEEARPPWIQLSCVTLQICRYSWSMQMEKSVEEPHGDSQACRWGWQASVKVLVWGTINLQMGAGKNDWEKLTAHAHFPMTLWELGTPLNLKIADVFTLGQKLDSTPNSVPPKSQTVSSLHRR